jgi:hypothetical protein
MGYVLHKIKEKHKKLLAFREIKIDNLSNYIIEDIKKEID